LVIVKMRYRHESHTRTLIFPIEFCTTVATAPKSYRIPKSMKQNALIVPFSGNLQDAAVMSLLVMNIAIPELQLFSSP
jgi:hypothetical protein